MPKLDTVSLLDELVKFGIPDSVFQQQLHHMGKTIDAFRKWSESVGYFNEDGCNQLLHDRLVYILTRCKDGKSSGGPTSFESLAIESKLAIPCSSYRGCKKHVSDNRF